MEVLMYDRYDNPVYEGDKVTYSYRKVNCRDRKKGWQVEKTVVANCKIVDILEGFKADAKIFDFKKVIPDG
jgi:acyl dehydratase